MPAAPPETVLPQSWAAPESAEESLRVLPLQCVVCKAEYPPAPIAICERCLGPLEPVYPIARLLPDRTTISNRQHSLWRYSEFLPLEGTPRLSLDTGLTPLV